MRNYSKYALITAVALCLLYSCTPTSQAADLAKSLATDPKIVAPDTAPPGTLVVIEAAVPESAKLAWAIDPPCKGFAVDTGGRLAYFANPKPGRYLIVLAAAVGDKVYALTHVLVLGDDPNPPPPPPPPPPPNQKYDVLFFIESNDLDNYAEQNPDWNIMLDSVKFRKDLKAKGHEFFHALDFNSILDIQSNAKLQPWHEAAKIHGKIPCMAISPIEGGKEIKVVDMPKSLDEFWKMIGEKP